MGREILYKAKRTDTKEWVEGCLLIDYVSGQYFIHAFGNCLNESDKVGEEGCLKFFAYEVDPETVCQYTGLTDRKGRKIFEGDIVKAEFSFNDFVRDRVEHKEHIYEISYHEKYCYFYLKRKNNNLLFDGNWSYALMEIEVIGNIFDNPELLNQ